MEGEYTKGRIRVYGFAEKTRWIINSALIPEVITVDAFCHVTGIARANYFRICSNERPPARDGRVSRVEITHRVLSAVTKTFSIPSNYFTSEYTLSEFEHLLNKGAWEGIVNMQSDRTSSDFNALQPASALPEGDTRFGPTVEKSGPELGIFRLHDLIAFEFNSQPNWKVTLLDHRPDGQVISLLPSVFASDSTLSNKGELRLPNESYWEVQMDDPPGTHTFVAIFHNQTISEYLSDNHKIIESLSKSSQLEDQRNALTDIYDVLNQFTEKRTKPYDIVVKDLYVAAG